MRIPTVVHGVLDVGTAAMLAAMPRRLGASPALSGLLMGKALGILAYSLCTRYELGLIKVLPMRSHLALDAMAGAGACVLPLLFSNEPAAVRLWLLGTGAFELFATFSTDPEPADPEMVPGASGAFVDAVAGASEAAHRRLAGTASARPAL
jgi:hypothetical protein